MPLVAEKLRPLFDNIIVRPVKENEKTPGGVYLPDNREKKLPERGMVVAVGPGRTLDNGTFVEPVVHVTDEIIFERWQSQEIEIDGEELLIVGAEHVMCVVESQPSGE